MSFIKHFSHEHPLFLESCNFDESYVPNLKCYMCRQLFVGIESCYGCCSMECFHIIHKACGDFPQHINHPLHLRHRLTLVIRKRSQSNNTSSTIDATTPTPTCCYYCDKPFSQDEPLYYACEECHDFNMHLTCANIQLPAITTCGGTASADKDGEMVHFVCHEKPMALVEKQEDVEGKYQGEKCFGCQSFWSADHLPAYTCTTNMSCNNFLHKSCVDKLSPTIQHPFHPQHPLTLQVSKPLSCDSCCTKDCWLVFSCVAERCNNNINLCVKCIFLEKNIECGSHDHSLSLVENFSSSKNGHGNIQCDACQNKDYYKKQCNEIKRTQSYLFRCMECDFNFHFLCGPLPITLKYECHIHPLLLVDHSETKDDSDEYYCDVCEEEREPQYRLYYCAACKYNAHIHCLLHQIIKVIKVDTENVELYALGENRWIKPKLDRQTNELTLKELMDSLTEEEKNIWTNPFDMDERGKKVWEENSNNYFKEENYNRSKGDVEDMDWIQRLFHFGDNDFSKLEDEFTIPLELKVEEKYLRQKLIEVDGYLVPKTLAPILTTLLHKHGDLGGNSTLTKGVKSVAATLLCAVVDNMCRTNLQDLTKDVLLKWLSDLAGASDMSGFKRIIAPDPLVQSLLLALPGLRALQVERDVGEKLDLEIAKLKEKLKKYEENRERLGKFKSEASEFMKGSFRKVEELKGKINKVGDLWFPYLNQ